MGTYSDPEKLVLGHDVASFHCGKKSLDEWLARFALINQSTGMSTTFVTLFGEHTIAGYYVLASGGAAHESVPSRIAKGVPRHAIPVVVLARLAVHEDHQGQGIGRALLRDALGRVNAAADEIGIRAFLIHAKDEEAKTFYMHQAEFELSPTNDLHLMLLMKDLRKALRG
jgi:GNAT superfamily N-acetyltransferase